MGTSYLDVYSRFADQITDYYMLDLSDEDACQYCYKLLRGAVGNSQQFIHSFTMNDAEYSFVDDLDLVEIEYLACAMTTEWIKPQLQSTILTKHYIGTKDEKFFSPAKQIEQLRALRDDNIARTKKIRRDYNYTHSNYFT